MPKVRVDVLLVGRGLAESRAQAQRLIMAGKVRLDGQVVLKPGASIQEDARLEVDQGPPFVSRGGEKLQAALATFALDVSGRACADVGASTGGFTDCLLQHGARCVYAIDVGQGILHWKLRQDLRVVVMERTNARHVERLPEPVSLVTIDASFISLKILLPVVKGWFGPLKPSSSIDPTLSEVGRKGHDSRLHLAMVVKDTTLVVKDTTPVVIDTTPVVKDTTPVIKNTTPNVRLHLNGLESENNFSTGNEWEMEERGEVIALIKPQFEAGRAAVARGEGVIRDPAIHRQVLQDTLAFAQLTGYNVRGLIRSPLLGPKGNTEFLAWLIWPGTPGADIEAMIAAALPY